MDPTPTSEMGPDTPAIYQIRIGGHLGQQWAKAFDGLCFSLDHSDTLITGPVPDQAALYGLLKKVRDFGLTLISVNRIRASQPDVHEA